MSPLETERLILRGFTEHDVDALFALLQDREVNRFLPWFPPKTREDAGQFLQTRFLSHSGMDAYHYAVCLKTDNVPIGYINVSGDDSRDFGYAVKKSFWNRGIVTEAGRAVIERLKYDGVPYITATHDVKNPASGAVMRKLGMTYQYTYEELWQPKNITVHFRLYLLNLDGKSDRTFSKYWNLYPNHFVEKLA